MSATAKKLRASIASIVLLAAVGAAAPSRAFSEVSFEYFHSSLMPHGSWHVSASFGRVWHPYVEVAGWHPYTHGQWVYTDFGWTWVSNYAWGAIPFHYGTWVIEPGIGWVWVPGYTWAPAWVVYRSGPSYIGWAPVPPRFSVGVSFAFHDYYEPDYFVFVPDRYFCERDVHRYAVGRSRAPVIYNQTTIINNISIDNDVVVNRGLDFARIERVAARRPERARIEQILPRVAPVERVGREARERPREFVRLDPEVARRGRVPVVAGADARTQRDARPERGHARRGREQATRERSAPPAAERIEQPAASPRRERAVPPQQDRVERDEAQRARQQQRGREDQRAREEEQRSAERPRDRATRQEQERTQRDEQRGQQQRVQQEQRVEQQRRRNEQVRAEREQQQRLQQEQRVEQLQRRRNEQVRAEREQQRMQQQLRTEQQHLRNEQDRAQRQQQRMQQERRAGQQQERRAEQQQMRQAQQQRERSLQQRGLQRDGGEETAPPESRGRGRGRDRG